MSRPRLIFRYSRQQPTCGSSGRGKSANETTGAVKPWKYCSKSCEYFIARGHSTRNNRCSRFSVIICHRVAEILTEMKCECESQPLTLEPPKVARNCGLALRSGIALVD